MAAILKFSDLTSKISKESLDTIDEYGFSQMTPVQSSTIPLFLSHKDVCVEATTGSGKTIAFSIPVFEIIKNRAVSLGKYDVGALILAPTRELATQIHDVIGKFADHHKSFSTMLLVGGVSIKEDCSKFEEFGANIIVGTPGRVLDLKNKSQLINFRSLEVLILDEADTLLDMGFKDTINQILSFLPKQRRTGLFSATQTSEVRELARAGLRNPVSIAVKVQGNTKTLSKGAVAQSTPTTLQNFFVASEYDQRPFLLSAFVQKYGETSKIIVFCATCACVDYYSQVFEQLSRSRKLSASAVYSVYGLHGKMVAKKRKGVYKKFVDASAGVLFCTDVAARGIDIPDVDWIVQWTAPKDPAFFVHRVGRTARAGRQGGALLFITKDELAYIELLRGRGVPLQEHSEFSSLVASSGAEKPILEEMKAVATQDRDVLEAGSTAFMAFLRSYQEHLCSHIFRFIELDIGAVARSYGLLRLPKIPETRGVKGKPIVFETSPVDTSTIPYRHKEKEQARLKRLQEGKIEQQQAAEEKARLKLEKGQKSEEKKAKWLPAEEYKAQKAKEEAEHKRVRNKKQSFQQKMASEWDELAAEEMLFKKLKRGKVAPEVYDSTFVSEDVLAIDDLTGDPVLMDARAKEEDPDSSDDGGSGGDDSDSDEEVGKSRGKSGKQVFIPQRKASDKRVASNSDIVVSRKNFKKSLANKPVKTDYRRKKLRK